MVAREHLFHSMIYTQCVNKHHAMSRESVNLLPFFTLVYITLWRLEKIDFFVVLLHLVLVLSETGFRVEVSEIWKVCEFLHFFLRVTLLLPTLSFGWKVGGRRRREEAHNAKDNGKEVVCRRHYSVIPTNLSRIFSLLTHIWHCWRRWFAADIIRPLKCTRLFAPLLQIKSNNQTCSSLTL